MRSSWLARIFLLAWYASAAFAAQTNLSGIVSDSLGNPVSGAIVFVKSANLKDTTDANGRYAIQNPPVAVLGAKNPVMPLFDVIVTHDAIRVFVPQKQAVSINVFDV